MVDEGTARAARAVGPGGRRGKGQRAAAAAITVDAPCRPVWAHPVIEGPARMPSAAIELIAPDGALLGHVGLGSTHRGVDLTVPFWLVGDPTPGSPVALISADRTQVVLPATPLRAGPVTPRPWSERCCRMLGWSRADYGGGLPPEAHAALAAGHAPRENVRFRAAVRRFRFIAVLLPVVYVAVLFPYLFLVPGLIHGGTSIPAVLALPVLGGVALKAGALHAQVLVGQAAEELEAGASADAKPIAYTQSYWASMRRPAVPWEGPLPTAVR